MQRRRLLGLLRVGEWPLITKMLATLIGGVMLVGAIVIVTSVRFTRRAVEREVQEQFATLATGKMVSMARVLEQHFATLRGISADESIIQVAQEANDAHTVASELYLSSVDQNWETASDESELIRSITDPELNEITGQLLSYLANLPDYQLILVTDRLGALIAATTRTETFFQAYQNWWTPTYNNGRGALYVSLVNPLTQPGVETSYVEVAAPIYADEGGQELIGGVYARIEMQAFVEVLRAADLAGGHQTLVTNRRGRVLAATEADMLGTTVDPTWSERDYQVNERRHTHEAVTLEGKPVLLGHSSMPFVDIDRGDDAATLNGLGWILFVYEPLRSAYAGASRAGAAIWIWGLGALIVTVVGGYLLTRSLAAPIGHLKDVVRRVREGDRAARAWVYLRHEIGAVGHMLNDLLDERERLETALVAQEESRESERARRLRDIQLTSSVGDVISLAADERELSHRIVDLVHEHYSLYFVGIYLVDTSGRWVVLQAGTGEAGKQLLARGHRLPIGVGVAGACVAGGRQRIERDLSSVERRDADVLPYARSEVAVPLRSRGRVIGALVALSYQSDTFDEELVLALQTIADQVGVAIDSIRLSNESEATSERLRKAYGELSRRAWQEALGTRAGYGYEARTTGVEALDATPPDHWDDGLRQAWQRDRVVSETREEDYGVQTQTLAIPVRARGEVIGVLDVAKLAEEGAWTALEREQLSGLADQLGQALENARLYEVTQRSALEQEMIGQATRRMRETLSVDTVLQTAVRELQGLLDLEAVEIRVGPTNGEPGAGNGAGGEGMSDDD